jgi:hypothetical protein
MVEYQVCGKEEKNRALVRGKFSYRSQDNLFFVNKGQRI